MTSPQAERDPYDEAKARLRREVRERRRARTPDERLAVDGRLAVRAGAIPEIAALVVDPTAGCVAAYASFGTEPGTVALRALLAISGLRVLLPVIRQGRVLDWAWDDDDNAVRPGSLAIPEPRGVVVGTGATGLLDLGCRVLLVPALAVTRDGRRLGQGGGYYDRLLAGLDADPRPSPLLVVVVHDDDVVDDVPLAPHDRSVDGLLTPSEYWRVR